MSGWEALGPGAAIRANRGASASPFEGLAEKMNWLSLEPAEDPIGKALLEAMPLEQLKEFTVDPQVTLPGGDGKKGSLFDQLEDLDYPDALAKCKEIAAAQEPAKPPAAAEPAAPSAAVGLEENGHHVVQAKIDASKPKWAALNAKGSTPAVGMAFPVMLVADQDEASAGEGGWCPFLRYGKLVYNGAAAAELQRRPALRAADPHQAWDKAGAGAEYSALEVFAGRLITMDDRTGNVDEIVPGNGFNFSVQPSRPRRRPRSRLRR